jgi:HSP20 family protein
MARLSVYDPFAEVFPQLFRGFAAPTRERQAQPLEVRVDVKENANAYTVHAEMPGVAKEDIHVEIDGNRVSISGEVRRENLEKDGERLVHSERYFGSVARSFTLANEIDDDKSEAHFENGVLTLTLPKRAAASSRKLRVN